MSRRAGALLLVAGVLLSGCSARSAAGESSAPPTSAVGPGRASAQQVVDAFRTAGLSTAGLRDTTAELCPTDGCTQALSTDAVVVRVFPTSGRAEIYSNPTGSFHFVAVALTFTGVTTAQQQQEYERIATQVAG